MANVLVIDDDADQLGLCRELLERAGHHVTSGSGGRAGLLSMKTGVLPDCVLLDVDMPEMSGPGMAHQMLLNDAGEQNIPILLVSGRHDLPEIAGRMGTPYFLTKATLDYGQKLLRILARALRERRGPTTA
ncbi:MAG: Two-component response regulator [Labilithrix sp.]|nr:Two-component response regulator [Labilithrix sp.]